MNGNALTLYSWFSFRMACFLRLPCFTQLPSHTAVVLMRAFATVTLEPFD